MPASLSDRRIHRLTDIAQHAGLDISTALRILKDLECEGFVERDPESKHYMLGPQVYAMHHAMVDGLDLRGLARPALIRAGAAVRGHGDSVDAGGLGVGVRGLRASAITRYARIIWR